VQQRIICIWKATSGLWALAQVEHLTNESSNDQQLRISFELVSVLPTKYKFREESCNLCNLLYDRNESPGIRLQQGQRVHGSCSTNHHHCSTSISTHTTHTRDFIWLFLMSRWWSTKKQIDFLTDGSTQWACMLHKCMPLYFILTPEAVKYCSDEKNSHCMSSAFVYPI
jgi:hypothetical protein